MIRGAFRAAPFSAAFTCAALTLWSCGPAQSKPPAVSSSSDEPPPETAAPSPEASSDAAAPPVSDNPAPEAAETKPPPQSEPQLSAAELCQKMCDRVKERCSADATEACRNNCREWDSKPSECDAEVRSALDCARKAEDLQCVNIMPGSCTKKFKQIDACAAGKRIDTKEMSLDLPSGWQRFTAKDSGFSVPMPPGVESKEASGEKTYSASVGAVSYSVRVLPAPPPGKKDLLVAQGVLGECMKKLVLKGLIERPERRSMEFKANCPGGRQTSGLLVTIGSKFYVVQVLMPDGAQTDRDVFVYGFRAPL
jgi:hypothetical protein